MTSSKVVSKGSCEACGSSDANVLYDDNHTYCFSCQTYTKGDGMQQQQQTKYESPIRGVHQKYFSKGDYQPLTDRKISENTCKFYGVTVKDQTIPRGGGKDCSSELRHIYPYYDESGSLVANKIRTVKSKSFFVEGSLPSAKMFGQNKFSNRGKFVTICEGEIDAMSAFEMLGSKWPVLSVKSGAQSALKDIKANYEYLNGFDKIVICFDNDEHGKKAANQVAQVFEPNKCLIMKMTKKDANEYIKDNKREEFTRAWWDAKPYTPAGIVNLADIADNLYDEEDVETVLYPYDGLNEKLFGLRTGELVTFTAGTGAGKSSMMRELMYHLLINSEHNIGIFSLEENKRQTAFHLMSVAASDRLYIKEIRDKYTKEELRKFEDPTIRTGRYFAFDHFGSITTDEILNRVRYMVKALDCKFIILDHLSILVSGLEGEDERRNIDQLMTKLRSLVEETRCAMLLVSHLRRASGDKGQEQGKEISLSMLRGSHSIAQISDAVIALERDQQANDPVTANTTTVRVLKNRYAGETGVATYLQYDKDTGRMTEIENPFDMDEEQTDLGDFL